MSLYKVIYKSFGNFLVFDRKMKGNYQQNFSKFQKINIVILKIKFGENSMNYD